MKIVLFQNCKNIYVYNDYGYLDNPSGPALVSYDGSSRYYAKPAYFCNGFYLGENLSNEKFKKLYSQTIKEQIFK